ncbi:MAG: CotH kinase family protein [Saprospiraceae bacterium]|nr:CotH kinase family protein [Saprospiraceae bacterium]
MRLPTLLETIFLWLLCGLPLLVPAQMPSQQAYQPPPLSVEFLPQGGFYQDSLTVELLCPGAIIYYTTDGAQPNESNSRRYSRPFKITATTVVRAMSVLAGERSNVFSTTYFINEPPTSFPVVSLSITPSLLFDPLQGLFMRGTNAVDSLWHLPGANFWSRRELTANMEIFEANGQLVWRNLVGFRLFGGMSRLFPQKSMAIVARKRYGDSRIRYPIFGKNGLKKFKYLVLRNSGSDFGRTHFRDALMTDLVKKWDLDVQDYRPAHVYINGKYWGIYNLREKINRFYVAGHYPVDKDSIDLIEHRLTRRYGRTDHYRRLLDFMEKNSLADPANFAYVSSQMEVNNFMDLQIAQIYFDNQDAGGNIKFWRPQTPNGRWRWILYDTDWGFGLSDPRAYRNNSLAFHTEPNGPNWPNPPWSTFILRKLLENKDFERRFVNRFCDYLNDDLDSTAVLARIEKFYQRLLPEMPRHLERWRLKGAEWQNDVALLKTFAAERPAYLRRFLMQQFHTGGVRQLSLGIAKGGKVVLNEAIDFRDTFSGKYFEKIPIRLQAVPDLGYRFVRWEGSGVSSESPVLFLELVQPDWHIRAVFEKFEHPLAGKIVINEISCNNKQSGDWVELYNNSKERVNLEHWILADRKNEFRFPAYTLPPKGYVVVCEDSAKFLRSYPKVQSLINGLSFGLDKRQETIQLFSPETSSVDSVGYRLPPMDSVFTLNLLLPGLDNGDPGNWELTSGMGSPDAANAYYLASRIQVRRSLFMQIGGALGVLVLGLLLLWMRRKGYF